MSTDRTSADSDSLTALPVGDTSDDRSNRAVRQFLQLMRISGVSHLPKVRVLERTRSAASLSAGRRSQIRHSAGFPPAGSLRSTTGLLPESVETPPMSDDTTQILTRPLATADDKSKVLCDLSKVVAACRRCTELAEFRTQTVFGIGNADARIMFIGEAPGVDEDRQGEPFVGRAGQLLNRIIEACQLKREDLYICNILCCRPPGNRNPRPQEAGNCREFLDAQIRVVQPEFIVCWGTVAAQNLLGEKRSIGRLRRQFLKYGAARVLCTYHPSYLLRNPAAKKDVWDDMKFFMKEVGVEL